MTTTSNFLMTSLLGEKSQAANTEKVYNQNQVAGLEPDNSVADFLDQYIEKIQKAFSDIDEERVGDMLEGLTFGHDDTKEFIEYLYDKTVGEALRTQKIRDRLIIEAIKNIGLVGEGGRGEHGFGELSRENAAGERLDRDDQEGIMYS